MKVLIAIIRSADDGPVTQQLINQGYDVTRMTSMGGFLRQGNVTLLIGVPEESIDPVCDLIRESCSPAPEGQYRANVFVLDAYAFNRL